MRHDGVIIRAARNNSEHTPFSRCPRWVWILCLAFFSVSTGRNAFGASPITSAGGGGSIYSGGIGGGVGGSGSTNGGAGGTGGLTGGGGGGSGGKGSTTYDRYVPVAWDPITGDPTLWGWRYQGTNSDGYGGAGGGTGGSHSGGGGGAFQNSGSSSSGNNGGGGGTGSSQTVSGGRGGYWNGLGVGGSGGGGGGGGATVTAPGGSTNHTPGTAGGGSATGPTTGGVAGGNKDGGRGGNGSGSTSKPSSVAVGGGGGGGGGSVMDNANNVTISTNYKGGNGGVGGSGGDTNGQPTNPDPAEYEYRESGFYTGAGGDGGGGAGLAIRDVAGQVTITSTITGGDSGDGGGGAGLIILHVNSTTDRILNQGTISGGNGGAGGGSGLFLVGTNGAGTIGADWGGILENNGTIRGGSSGGSGVLGNNAVVINNAGKTISGTGYNMYGTGSYGVHLYSNGTYTSIVDNSGTISGYDGVKMSGVTGEIYNAASATISGTRYGIDMEASGGLIENLGTVTGGTTGITVSGSNAYIYNAANASITGTTTSGVALGGSNGVLDNDGSIRGGNYGVYISGSGVGQDSSGNDNYVVVNNNNSIYGGSHGISTSTGSRKVVINNDKEIEGGSRGISMAGSDSFVFNTDTIKGNDYGIHVSGNDDYIHNAEDAKIESASGTGVALAGRDDILVNDGDIDGGSRGVWITSTGTGDEIYNKEGAIINGGTGAGVQMDGGKGLLHNVGTVTSTTGSGVIIGGSCNTAINTITEDGIAGVIQGGAIGVSMTGKGGVLFNDSELSGDTGVSTSSTSETSGIVNSARGEILGVDFGANLNGHGDDLFNAGKISASAATGVGIAVGNSGKNITLTNTQCGSIEANGADGIGVDLGGKDSYMKNFGIIKGGNYGSTLTGIDGTLYNAKTIEGGVTGASVTGTGNVFLNASGALVKGNVTGMEIESDGFVQNDGTISGVATGVSASGVGGFQLVNNNSITATGAGGTGLVIDADGQGDDDATKGRTVNLYNTGVISATNSGGTGVQAGGKNLTLINEKSISGNATDGYGFIFQSADGDSQNSFFLNDADGSVTGYTGAQIHDSGATIINESGASITGTSGRDGSVGVRMDGRDNAVENYGVISGNRYGAELNGDGNRFGNYGGSLSGKTGLFVSGTGENAYVFNTGDISGTGVIPGSDGYGVHVDVGASGAHIVNAGAISGANGEAVLIEGTDSTLEVWNGFSFAGAANSTGGGNTFALGGLEGMDATFDAGKLGSSADSRDINGFEYFVKMGDAIWELTGDQTTIVEAKDWTVRDGGGLVVMNEGLINNIHIQSKNPGEDERDVFAAFDFAGTYGGSISGDGEVYKIGGGSLTFTGNSDLFEGTTHVAGGSLTLDSELGGDVRIWEDSLFTLNEDAVVGGSVFVNDGGDFMGGGTIQRDLNVLSGGSVSFIGDTGTITVDNNFVFEDGAVMNVFINHSGADINSLIEVGGEAIVGRGTIYLTGIEIPDNGKVEGFWTIVNAPVDGVTITGCDPILVSNTNYLYFTPELIIDEYTINIGLRPNRDGPGIPIDLVGATHNQKEAARVLNRYREGKLYNHLLLLTEDNNVESILDHFTGEVHATAETVREQRDMRFGRLLRSRSLRVRDDFSGGDDEGVYRVGSNGGALASLNPMAWQPRSNTAVWAEMEGSSSRLSYDANAALGQVRGMGVTAGIETRIRDELAVGMALHYSRDRLWVDERSSKAVIDSFQVGGYISNNVEFGPGRVRVTGGAMAGLHQSETERRIRFNSFDEELGARYWSQSAGVFGEVGWASEPFSGFLLEPYFGVDYRLQRTSGFDETGGSAALSSDASRRSGFSTTLGIRASGDVTDWMSVDLDTSWRVNYRAGEGSKGMYFSDSLTKGTMDIIGGDVSKNEWRSGVGLRVHPKSGLDMRVGYDATLGRRTTDHNGSVSMGVSF